ncbi:hypothetical protein DVS77_11920 [Mycolicibacterium moriokaense]|nr:hypothetical protein DVS77_11920 [Mycolicibacterium moriokaense]
MTQFRIASAIAAGAIAIGAAMTVALPVANAQTEQQIKAGCKEAGGTYGTQQTPLGQASSCRYKDINGDVLVDSYINGKYVATDPCYSKRCLG